MASRTAPGTSLRGRSRYRRTPSDHSVRTEPQSPAPLLSRRRREARELSLARGVHIDARPSCDEQGAVRVSPSSRHRSALTRMLSSSGQQPSGRSQWRLTASRAARRASSADAGPLTPTLLLSQERGHQDRADAGFRSGRNPLLPRADPSTVPLRHRAAVGFEPRACRRIAGMQARALPLRRRCVVVIPASGSDETRAFRRRWQQYRLVTRRR